MAEQEYKRMADFTRIDRELLNPGREGLSLSVSIGTSSIAFAVLDEKNNRYLGLGEISQESASGETGPGEKELLAGLFDKIVDAFPWIRQARTGNVMISCGKYTLVPAAYYVPGQEEHYLSFNVATSANELIRHDRLESLSAVNIYAIPRYIYDFAIDTFHPGKVSHFSTALLAGIMQEEGEGTSGNGAYLHFRDQFIDILILDRGRLRYFNTFAYHTAEDIVYYVIFVLEQFGMEPSETLLHLYGNIKPEDRAFKLLYRYTKDPRPGEPVRGFSFSPVFADIAVHRYFPLLSLPRCGS